MTVIRQWVIGAAITLATVRMALTQFWRYRLRVAMVGGVRILPRILRYSFAGMDCRAVLLAETLIA